MKYSALTLFIIIGFLSSCGPKINKTQQQQLANLTDSVSTIAENVNSLDSAALMQLADEFFNRKNYVQKEMTDTLSRDVIFKLDAFLRLRKEMGFIRGEFPIIKSEANIMNKQVIDLNHDVSKRLIEEKQFNRYFELEKTNFDELKSASEQLLDVTERAKTKYFELVPEIDSIITAYKAGLNE